MIEEPGKIARRIQELSDRLEELGNSDDESVRLAIHELGNAIEELEASQEELRSQSEWLSRSVREAERERARYQELFEFAPDGYLVTDIYGVVSEANRASCSMLGLRDKSGLLNKPLAIFFQGTDKREFMSFIAEVRTSEESPGIVLQMLSRTGRSFPVYLKAVARRDSTGEAAPIRWLLRDFTDRLIDEARLAEAKEKLEQYTSTVSHDLKGPVSTMLLGMRFLREDLKSADSGVVSDEVFKTIDAIENNAQKSYELIAGLLEKARSEKTYTRGTPVDINKLVGRIIEDHVAVMRDSRVEFEIENDLGTVRMTELELYQVFANLLDNAIQHGNSEKPIVKVARVEDDRGASFVVRDNGMGFPRSMIESRHGEGLGLGLTIVYRIVSENGGDMRLSNDGGAVVEVALTTREEQPMEHPYESRAARVLVIEDEPGTAYLISKLIKKSFGAEAQIAKDRAEAERMLAREEFDLVTLDYMLPDGDGKQLMEELAKNPVHPTVIVVTGHGDEKLAAAFLEMGARGYVVKDAEMPEMLRRAIGRALDERVEGRPAGTGAAGAEARQPGSAGVAVIDKPGGA